MKNLNEYLVGVENYELVKGRTCVRLMPARKVEDLKVLANLGDLAVVGRVHLDDLGEYTVNLGIPSDLFDRWGVSEDDFIRDAIANMGQPSWAVADALECLCNPIQNPFDDAFWTGVMDAEKAPTDPTCLTIRKDGLPGLYGAVALALPGLPEKVCEVLGDRGFVVVFTSIHEAMIHSLSNAALYGADAMHAIAEDVARSCCNEDEVLSTHVYLYTRMGGWSILA